MEERSGLGVAGFVLGLVGILFFWIPVIGLILGILGIIFSILGIRRSKKRGLAITGLVLSIVGLLLAVIMTILLIFAIVYISQAVGNFSFLMKDSNYTFAECKQTCEFIAPENTSCVSGCGTGDMDSYVNSLKNISSSAG
jgi:amino acid transporter